MAGKTGAARIALRTGCPVVPIGQWGAQELMYGRQIHFPKLLPRKTLRLLVGDPVPLDDLRDRPVTAATLDEATDRIMDAITALVAELRQEPPPAERFDPAVGSSPETERHDRAGASAGGSTVMGSGSWGTAFALVLADAAQRGHPVGPPARARRGDQRRAPQSGLLPDHRPAGDRCARSATRPRPWTAPSSWCSPCRRSRCGATWSAGRCRRRPWWSAWPRASSWAPDCG